MFIALRAALSVFPFQDTRKIFRDVAIFWEVKGVKVSAKPFAKVISSLLIRPLALCFIPQPTLQEEIINQQLLQDECAELQK